MAIRRVPWMVLLALTVVGGLGGIFLMTTRAGSAVDWRALRTVTFESDDWGLAGFVPDAESWHGLSRETLHPGNFPEVYWLSTLEDSAAVADLCGILAAHSGRDGFPAVFQPNYVMSSLDLEPAGDTWRRYDLPQLPPTYDRPGLWAAVTAGLRAGIWYPEFHATWHYDPNLRRESTAANDEAQRAAARGIMLFPGGERARELGPWRAWDDLAAELDGSLVRFAALFGRAPGSVIAPDYTWDARIEKLWQTRGLRVIQAKREQRHPGYGGGGWDRLRKVVDRQWSRRARPGRAYLERNCRLEPVQAAEATAVVRSCLQEVARAWRRGEPAVIETHRINFVHTDPAVVRTGQESLADFLRELTSSSAGTPIFLTDFELAQLGARGTSWCVRGGSLIARNAAHGRRVVTIPAEALNLAARQRGMTLRRLSPLLVALGSQRHVELIPGQHFSDDR